MNILQLLANDGFICVNKHLIKQLGLEEAVLIGELASMYIYNQSRNLLEDDWFYATVKRIEDNTGLSDYKQQQIIKNLVSIGLLECKVKGMPPKRFLKFNKQKLAEIALSEEPVQYPKIRMTLSENSDNNTPKIRKLISENSDNIYNNTINNNTNNNTDNTQAGDTSNKNNNSEILEENTKSQTTESSLPDPPPPVKVPKISPRDRISKSLLEKILEWDDYPETQQAVENYILFLMDTYNDPNTTIKNKLTQIKRMAGGSAKGVEIICNFNIDRNYRNVYKPNDYKKQLADSSVISEEFTGEFVTDENGEIEEIW